MSLYFLRNLLLFGLADVLGFYAAKLFLKRYARVCDPPGGCNEPGCNNQDANSCRRRNVVRRKGHRCRYPPRVKFTSSSESLVPSVPAVKIRPRNPQQEERKRLRVRWPHKRNHCGSDCCSDPNDDESPWFIQMMDMCTDTEDLEKTCFLQMLGKPISDEQNAAGRSSTGDNTSPTHSEAASESQPSEADEPDVSEEASQVHSLRTKLSLVSRGLKRKAPSSKGCDTREPIIKKRRLDFDANEEIPEVLKNMLDLVCENLLKDDNNENSDIPANSRSLWEIIHTQPPESYLYSSKVKTKKIGFLWAMTTQDFAQPEPFENFVAFYKQQKDSDADTANVRAEAQCVWYHFNLHERYPFVVQSFLHIIKKNNMDLADVKGLKDMLEDMVKQNFLVQ